MEAWRNVWRVGVVPQMSSARLEALRHALLTDDPALIQGATTSPPPLDCVKDWPVEAACAISFCGWDSQTNTVGKVEEHFAKTCFEADKLLGEPGAIRFFINWFDDTPRAEMRRELLAETNLAIGGTNQIRLQRGSDCEPISGPPG